MHHITWNGKTEKIHAKDIAKVLKLTALLRSQGIEYKHIFWD
jgi:hypothetical protein